MQRTIYVFGNYGLDDQTELERFTGLTPVKDAQRWCAGYCRRDLGGYSSIEAIEFAADGEAITHWRKSSDEDDGA